MRLGDFLVIVFIGACVGAAVPFVLYALFWLFLLISFGISDLLSI